MVTSNAKPAVKKPASSSNKRGTASLATEKPAGVKTQTPSDMTIENQKNKNNETAILNTMTNIQLGTKLMESIMLYDKGQTFQDLFKNYSELSVFFKNSVDAMVRSGTIIAKGLEDMGRSIISMNQTNIETVVSTTKTALTCTTLRQIVDLQTDYAKTNFDKLITEGSKLSELSIKVVDDAFEPIQNCVFGTAECFSKPAT